MYIINLVKEIKRLDAVGNREIAKKKQRHLNKIMKLINIVFEITGMEDESYSIVQELFNDLMIDAISLGGIHIQRNNYDFTLYFKDEVYLLKARNNSYKIFKK